MKRVLAIVVLFMLLFSMAACAGSGSKSGKTLIGISMPTRTAERWITEGEIMRDKLVEAGYDVDLQYANDQVPDQVSQIENMITKGAKFLIICPIDGESLSDPLATAKKQNIQVLAYDRLIMKTADIDYFVGFDSVAIGNIMGDSLMRGIGADSASGPLYIELFAGSLDDSNTPYYFDGAMEKIQPYLDSGKVIVKSGQTSLNEVATPGWDGLAAQNRMQNLLSAHYTTDTLAGALSPYDGISLGIIGALKAVNYGGAGKPMPAVTGQDCELPSLISIWNDEQYSSIFLDLPFLGGRAVEVAIAMLEGKNIAVSTTYNNEVKEVDAYLADANELTKATIPQFFFDRGTYTEADLKLQ
jgi:putative multiple sugar transport system substrate-binding protein